VRTDVGLTLGRMPLLEPFAGVACYIMSLPVLAVGLIIMLVLQAWQQSLSGGGPSPDDFNSPVSPGHPIVVYLARGGWGLRLQVLFVASIVAPIVEETMFRGVLYRHLRELSCWIDRIASVIFSALVSSFIFAVIHPQGLVAVPMLMSLAFGFVMAREWRGTLLPGMVAHGINNGVVLMLSILILGD